MNILKKALYHTLKPWVKAGFRTYFKKVIIVNPERRNATGPMIANCNHPATLMDPLCSALSIKRYFHFLANIGLFRTKIGAWFLDQLWCIPIERHIDMKGQPLNNTANFESAMQLMERGGCLHIAPEGFSEVERRLRKIRTGTARISLYAEARNDFKLGIHLQPVGITYSDQLSFRSDCMIILGEPIRVADFEEEYKKDDREAVRALTDTIRQRLTDITIVTEDDEENNLLLAIEDIQQSEKHLEMEAHLWRTKRLQSRLAEWKSKELNAFNQFADNARSYAQSLKALKSTTTALLNQQSEMNAIQLVLGFPFFLFGYVNHFICCWLPKLFNDKFNDTESFIPTYKLVAGLFTFPIFYVLQTWFIYKISGDLWLAIGYAITLIPSGLIAEWWLNKWKFFKEQRNIIKVNPAIKEQLLSIRKAVLENLYVRTAE